MRINQTWHQGPTAAVDDRCVTGFDLLGRDRLDLVSFNQHIGFFDELFVLYSEQDFIPETIMGKAVEDVTPALSALLRGTSAMEFLRISHHGGELKRAREGDPKNFFAGRVLLQLKS